MNDVKKRKVIVMFEISSGNDFDVIDCTLKAICEQNEGIFCNGLVIL